MPELTPKVVAALRAEYFPNDGLITYMVVDGASTRALIDHLYDDQAEFACLISGALEPDMQEVAPYLVVLRDGERFAEWILKFALGEHWGIVLRSWLPTADLTRRYSNLLRVRGPDGEPLFFRFYDPRVLRTYLPTCVDDEVLAWFDGVDHYLVEAETPGLLLRFSADGNAIKTAEIELPQADD
jgi:hypothetical protein